MTARSKGWLHLGRKFWIPFLTACVISMLVEALFEHALESQDTSGGGSLEQSIFNFTGFYTWMFNAARTPLQRYTVPVKIDVEHDNEAIASNDVCGQREQIARVVCRIHRASPKVIVLDKYYGNKNCSATANPTATNDFQNAIQEVNKDVPVIVGRRVSDRTVEVESNERFFLTPSMDFGVGPTIGIINIDPDTRKLPLQWPLYPSEKDAQEAMALQWYDTLALSASRAYDRSLLVNHPRLNHLLEKHEHPYISFLKQDEFRQQVSVGEVLKGAKYERGGETFCPDERAPPELQETMSGKVVVIGEVHPRDWYASVAGKMPGYLMQANFIEALLDERYYRAMPILDYVFGFLILAALEYILIFYKNQGLAIGLLSVLLLIIAAGLVWITFRLFYWYVNPILVGVTGIVVRLMGSLFHRAEENAEPSVGEV